MKNQMKNNRLQYIVNIANIQNTNISKRQIDPTEKQNNMKRQYTEKQIYMGEKHIKSC